MQRKSSSIYVLLFLFVLLGITRSCSNGVSNKTEKVGEVSSTISSDNTSEPTEKSLKTYKLGDIVQTDDRKITLISYDDFKQINGHDVDVDKGYKSVKISFEVENTSKEDISVSSYDFSCYADDYICDNEIYLNQRIVTESISAGKKIKGCTLYKIPTSAKKIEIEYSEGFWDKNKVMFSIKSN